MNLAILILSFVVFFSSLKLLSVIKYRDEHSYFTEIKHNCLSLICGLSLITSLVSVTYQIWVLVGSPNSFAGGYFVLGTALLLFITSFVVFYKFIQRES
ncbi:hypothetical protein [Gracilibacillus salinarum]|uniref:hypothetical protein n=1 Tax=Gracilibacillus salinarum TaxID=2932255 RepID=UPI0034E2DCDF